MQEQPPHPEDQVPRRERFEAAHPEVKIEFRGPHWRATWPEGSIVRLDLRSLLDVLEQQDPHECGTMPILSRRMPQPCHFAAPAATSR